jgi:hypothetical protein
VRSITKATVLQNIMIPNSNITLEWFVQNPIKVMKVKIRRIANIIFLSNFKKSIIRELKRLSRATIEFFVFYRVWLSLC